MQLPKRFLHDRIILVLLTIIAALVVVGVGLVLLRFDSAKNPTIIIEYRQNLSAGGYKSGKASDIYLLPLFMVFSTAVGTLLSLRAYQVRRYVSVYILATTAFTLLMAIIVSNALLSV